MNYTEINSHSLDPPEDPPDTDTRILDLETEVARLEAEFKYWSRHNHNCPARFEGNFLGINFSSPSSCNCGLTQARDKTLWDRVKDSEDITKALESWND